MGGCNPRFDRGALVARLQSQMPGITLAPFDKESDYLAVLVICGCTAQCARQEDLPESTPRLILKDFEEYEQTLAFLHGIDKEM